MTDVVSANDAAHMAVIAATAGFSLAAHAGQKRKFTGEDYYMHPKRVCEIVADHGYLGKTELQAALLHDVVEDTHITEAQVRQYFGDAVCDMVQWLTKEDHPEGTPRAVRKRKEAERLSKAPAIVKTIKLADRLDNCPDIIANDPEFAPVFLAETRHLLDHALKDGDEVLWNKVDAIVREFQDAQNIKEFLDRTA